MKLKYIGPHSGGVAVPLPTGGSLDVPHGEAVDVPDTVAGRLLQQPGNWVKVKPKPADKPPAVNVKEGE